MLAPNPESGIDEARKSMLADRGAVNVSKRGLKAIRAKCVDCSGGSLKEAARCNAFDCPLWPLRFGRTPEAQARRDARMLDPVHIRKLTAQDCKSDFGDEWVQDWIAAADELLAADIDDSPFSGAYMATFSRNSAEPT